MYVTRQSMLGRNDGFGPSTGGPKAAVAPMNMHMASAQTATGNRNGTHRAACCFVGCTGIIGPLLLIAGIILLTYPNDRDQLIETFNDRSSHFNASGVFQWSEDSLGLIDGQVTATKSEAVRCEGDDTNVNDFNSYFASVDIPWSMLDPNPDDNTNEQIPDTTILKFQLNSVIPFTRVVTPVVVQTIVTTCNDKHGCSIEEMTDQCDELYGSSATYDGTGCFNVGTCGVCRFPLYLQTYCAVATPIVPLPPEQENFAESDHYRSCIYPFTDADLQQYYGVKKPATVQFKVLKKWDPYLLLQELTKGSMDFGDSPKPMRDAGTSVSIIGGITVGIMLLSAFLLRRSVKASRRTGFETDSDDDDPNEGRQGGLGLSPSGIHAIRASLQHQQAWRSAQTPSHLQRQSSLGARGPIEYLSRESGATTATSASTAAPLPTTNAGSRGGASPSRGAMSGGSYQAPPIPLAGGGGGIQRGGGGGGGGGERNPMQHSGDVAYANNDATRDSECSLPPIVIRSNMNNTAHPRPPAGQQHRGGHQQQHDDGHHFDDDDEDSTKPYFGGGGTATMPPSMRERGGSGHTSSSMQQPATSQTAFLPPKPVHGFEVPLRFSRSNFLAVGNGGNPTIESNTPRPIAMNSGRRHGSQAAGGGSSQRQFIVPPALPGSNNASFNRDLTANRSHDNNNLESRGARAANDTEGGV